MRTVELDGDTADKITVLNLKDALEYLEKELEGVRNGEYMHPEDIVETEYKLIPALKTLIHYYGG